MAALISLKKDTQTGVVFSPDKPDAPAALPVTDLYTYTKYIVQKAFYSYSNKDKWDVIWLPNECAGLSSALINPTLFATLFEDVDTESLKKHLFPRLDELLVQAESKQLGLPVKMEMWLHRVAYAPGNMIQIYIGADI